ncbi:MAG: hypothetical protein ACEY3L_18990 [Wolbachia sp.]|uniref:hypothetical protein n=1 Tax=Wolbachia endosymbiont (group A) of Tiphia femorata TaxID=2954063 RepID=UPI0022315552|nr:hypothetical protein [Wolbachia endosymbiont (group A) of Tiphia femorata]
MRLYGKPDPSVKHWDDKKRSTGMTSSRQPLRHTAAALTSSGMTIVRVSSISVESAVTQGD